MRLWCRSSRFISAGESYIKKYSLIIWFIIFYFLEGCPTSWSLHCERRKWCPCLHGFWGFIQQYLLASCHIPLFFKGIRVQPFEINHQKQLRGLTHCTSEENRQTSAWGEYCIYNLHNTMYLYLYIFLKGLHYLHEKCQIIHTGKLIK
jgi:hypothetical protein